MIKFVCVYVIMGDFNDEDCYYMILDICNGKCVWFFNYDCFNWDLVSVCKLLVEVGVQMVLLSELMKWVGFIEQELVKMQEVLKLGDQFLCIEIIVFYVVKGEFDDGEGKFIVVGVFNQVMVQELVFDQIYCVLFGCVMVLINDFLCQVDECMQVCVFRVGCEYVELEQKIFWLLIVLVVVLFVCFGFVYCIICLQIGGELCDVMSVLCCVVEGDLIVIVLLCKNDKVSVFYSIQQMVNKWIDVIGDVSGIVSVLVLVFEEIFLFLQVFLYNVL